MRIYVISDTHVPERVRSIPEAFARQIQRGDILFHCGDFTSVAVYEKLERMAEFYGVYGNMDEPALLSVLRQTQTIEIAGKKVGITHGWGSSINLAQRVYDSFAEKPDIILFGHSHMKTNEMLNNSILFNPGAASGGWGESPSFGELIIEDGKIKGIYHNL